MKQNDFDQIIRRMKDATVPDCPPSLENNVLRRIRITADETTQSISEWLFGLVPQPQFILSAVALTLTVSLGSTIISTNLQADVTQKKALALTALDFDVFQDNDYLNLNNDNP
ncbi:hypothetical protein [Cerasicoccus fimbriatus]|uniref:hypothetical protein n=1 Tax=Cerasicoccus fimbriatus TaxID=3014554 RepID=UPI0022B59C99|nr:hypothetical protein [Cerasicoccus sp. TK19100]